MNHNKVFEKEEISTLIFELSKKYSLETYEVKDSISSTVAKVYGFERAVVTSKGSIIGLNKTSSHSFDLKHYNLSKVKHKQFLNELEQSLHEKTSKIIKNKISKIISFGNYILYGKIKEEKGNLLKFKLFNKNGQEIKNFYAFINKDEFFTNEINKKDFLEKGYLLYIPKREKLNIKNGILSIKAIRKHNEIIRYIINNRFKDIKSKLGASYGYDKCIIDIKSKKIILFLKLFFSKPVKEYFEEALAEYEDFKIIYINNFNKKENE